MFELYGVQYSIDACTESEKKGSRREEQGSLFFVGSVEASTRMHGHRILLLSFTAVDLFLHRAEMSAREASFSSLILSLYWYPFGDHLRE